MKMILTRSCHEIGQRSPTMHPILILCTLFFFYYWTSNFVYLSDTSRQNQGDGFPKDPKYFNEPCCDIELAHYDAHFFNGTLSDGQRRQVLRRLIRSYLRTTKAENIETWLAHGTLLGWW